MKCYPQLPAEFQYDFKETVSKSGKVNVGTVGYSSKKNKMPGGTEIYAHQDADNVKPKTFYFYLTDLDNVPQEDNAERMYKPFYDIQEEYYDGVVQNTHLCQLDFKTDPTLELGKKLTSAWRKEVRKLADANYHLNKNTNYDLRNNLRIATGTGVPNAKLQWDPYAKTFFVPGSQYDLQRSYNESVASNQEVERVDERAARAASSLGLVPNYNDVDTDSDLSSTPASSSNYSISLGISNISPITPIRTPRAMRGPDRIPSNSPSPRVSMIHRRATPNDRVNGGVSVGELAQVRTSLEEVQRNIANLTDQVRVMEANSPRSAELARRQPARRRVALRSPYELRRALARFDPNTFRGNRNRGNDERDSDDLDKFDYMLTFFHTFVSMYGPSEKECKYTRCLCIERKTFEDVTISLWVGKEEDNLIWDITIEKTKKELL